MPKPAQIKKNQFNPEQEVAILKRRVTDLERQIVLATRTTNDIAKDIREIKLFCNKIFKNNKRTREVQPVIEPKKNGPRI
jgi:hypothetical protein